MEKLIRERTLTCLLSSDSTKKDLLLMEDSAASATAEQDVKGVEQKSGVVAQAVVRAARLDTLGYGYALKAGFLPSFALVDGSSSTQPQKLVEAPIPKPTQL